MGGIRPGFAGPYESQIQTMLSRPVRVSVRREGPRGEPGFPPRFRSSQTTGEASLAPTDKGTWVPPAISRLLDVKDVREADHHQGDHDDEQDLDADREADHPLGAAR